MTMFEITSILEMMSDGRWYRLEEIQQKTGINRMRTLQIAEFLKKYNFIVADDQNGKVKIRRNAQKFLANLELVKA